MQSKFAILLATYNGAAFLEAQLESLLGQTVQNIDVWMSDDGSSDNTVDIARRFARKWNKGRFEIIERVGGSKNTDAGLLSAIVHSNENFRSLTCNKKIDADYFAYCDQDDIWHPDKLERAAGQLAKFKDIKPALFCSRTRIIDKSGKEAGLSLRFQKPPEFCNAIVQNIAAGNTIVMNRRAMDFIRLSSSKADYVSHDWWCYIAITAIGGEVIYSADPTVDYRQHDNNLIGENASWKARMVRLKLVVSGRFRNWNTQNLSALESIEAHITPGNIEIINDFKNIREFRGARAVVKLFTTPICRQTIFGQLSLYLASFLGKI